MTDGKKKTIREAAKAAFPYTVPIFAGFTFLGMAYGIYMRSLGFSALYPMIMSVTIFAGSMEFITANLLTQPFDILNALILTLLVNARHIFYGLSILDKYGKAGRKKYYLIFGMCDESFSINYSADVPDGIDKGWLMFFVTLFNQFYWFFGATLGGICGEFITFDTTGIDFVMTALFIVIFMNQFEKETDKSSSVCGILISIIALCTFGADKFIIAAMIGILICLTVLKKRYEKREVEVQ